MHPHLGDITGFKTLVFFSVYIHVYMCVCGLLMYVLPRLAVSIHKLTGEGHSMADCQSCAFPPLLTRCFLVYFILPSIISTAG